MEPKFFFIALLSLLALPAPGGFSQDAKPEEEAKGQDEKEKEKEDPSKDPSLARPPRAPSTSELAREPARRGVDFLLRAQNQDGSWGSGESARPIEVLADVPGSHHAFRAGTTALCVMALERSPFRDKECRSAADRGLGFLLDHALARRPNGLEMYNVWSFGYGLQAFAELLPKTEDPKVKDRMIEASKAIVKKLEIYQTPDGGWGYYDFKVGSYRPSDSSMSFTTATIVVALHAAGKQGIAIPRGMLDRAIKSLRRDRKDDGSYIYGPYAKYRPVAGYNQVKGSLGRTHSCNLALWLYGEKVNESDLRSGVENFFRFYRFMDIGRKRPWPHEAWYYTSGYYFYYGHYYAGLVLDLLPEGDRARWRPRLEKLLVERQEADGSWWDFPLYGYHKPYGTAYALLTLIR
jgi:hypothetical protein